MDNKQLSLSLVIPVYNEEDYIETCLEAVAKQTEAPDEVIVIDNNSTDKTVEIAQKFPFVKVIHESKQGLYFSRNTGVHAAKSDIIGRIDADTRLDPGWVSEVKRVFADPNIHIITGPLGYHDMPLPRFTKWLESVFLRVAVKSGYKFVFGANMALRRSEWSTVVDELCNKPFLLEDIDMAVHFQKHGMTPVYDGKVSGLVSARRFQDSPRDFWLYITGHPRTLSYHHKRAVGAYFATAMFYLVYILIKPLHMLFDPKTRRLSWKHLRHQPHARPDPMNVWRKTDN